MNPQSLAVSRPPSLRVVPRIALQWWMVPAPPEPPRPRPRLAGGSFILSHSLTQQLLPRLCPFVLE